MRVKGKLLSGSAALLLTVAGARADFTVTAPLLGSTEVPTNTSTASGLASFTYHTAANDLTYDVTYQGLSGPLTGAHIHFGSPTERGPIILPLTTNTTATSGELTGTLTSADLTPAATQGINNFQDAINALEADNTYFNIHSTVLPGGEIRGQLVPEPASIGLLGGVGLMLLRRRRQV